MDKNQKKKKTYAAKKSRVKMLLHDLSKLKEAIEKMSH